MAHIRGLHETGAAQALHVVRRKAEHGKLTTTLARLDHQRTLLERQLAVWTEKERVTRDRLRLLQRQLAEVGTRVRGLIGRRRAASVRRPAAAVVPGEQSDAAAVAPPRKQVNLDY